MAGKTSKDEPKVMDVARPGKGKIIVNSRPLAAPVVEEKAESGDVISEPAAAAAPEAPIQVPSAAKKVIQPINIISDESDESNDGQEAVIPEEDAPVAQSSDLGSETEKNVSESSESQETAVNPSATDSLPAPKADDSPIAPAAPATDQSGAASVDELAKAAEQKRLSAEKAKEEAERNQKVQELIDSKQYFVPIKHTLKNGKNTPLLVVLVILILTAVVYLILDLGLFGSNVKLPYEFFKDSDITSDTQATTQPADDLTSEDESQEQSTPTDAAKDQERRNELKNLQQQLEIYYNDNGNYPSSLEELPGPPTVDETTDDDGTAYGYKSDGEIFTLSVVLSDGTDYILNSVNQAP